MIQGSIETGLNAKGEAQALELAHALLAQKTELATYQFYVSPQLRAQETMAVIAAAQGRPPDSIIIDTRLRELGFGIWEGKPWWEVKASPLYPADAEGRYAWRPEGGESYADGVARMDQFLESLTGPSLIVAHGAIGRCLMGRVAGLSPEAIVNLQTPQGCYCKMDHGTFTWFDASHQPA